MSVAVSQSKSSIKIGSQSALSPEATFWEMDSLARKKGSCFSKDFTNFNPTHTRKMIKNKPTSKQVERYHSLINDLAETMPMSRWTRKDMEGCINYLSNELYYQRQDFNCYHGKLVSIASKMCLEVIQSYPSPKK